MEIRESVSRFTQALLHPGDTPRRKIARQLSNPQLDSELRDRINGTQDLELYPRPTGGLIKGASRRLEPTRELLRDPAFYHPDKAHLPNDLKPKE